MYNRVVLYFSSLFLLLHHRFAWIEIKRDTKNSKALYEVWKYIDRSILFAAFVLDVGDTQRRFKYVIKSKTERSSQQFK